MGIRCQMVFEAARPRRQFDRRVGLVIPAYNEADHLRCVLAKCRAVSPAAIVVVDDASTDATSEILRQEAREAPPGTWIRHLHNERNLGKQGSVRRGLQEIVRYPLDAIALIDGDGQHDPQELPRLAALIEEYDFVIGARARTHMPIQRRFSNWFVNLGFQLIGGVDFIDVQSGLRIYSPHLARVLAERLPERGGYALEHESLTLLARYAQERDRELRAAAAPISCAYGPNTSSMGPMHVLQLTVETFRQAARFRRAALEPLAAEC